jgi:hypothetical protein
LKKNLDLNSDLGLRRKFQADYYILGAMDIQTINLKLQG